MCRIVGGGIQYLYFCQKTWLGTQYEIITNCSWVCSLARTLKSLKRKPNLESKGIVSMFSSKIYELSVLITIQISHL